MIKPKLRESIGIVKLGNNTVEIFKGNIRKSIFFKMSDSIVNIILSLDGSLNINEIKDKFNLNTQNFEILKIVIYKFLKNGILLDANSDNISKEDRYIYHRIISMLEDYSSNSNDTYNALESIKQSNVLIIGVGAIGSWISLNLIQSSIKNIILMDNDKVELSNLHRQYGYYESDIGKYKVNVLRDRLLKVNPNANIKVINKFLEPNSLESLNLDNIDLIINCADSPSVDITSEIVASFCMKNNIPHIISGGYNKHISLIGPTIIPFETACYKCIDIQLQEMNNFNFETNKLKKLIIPNRKIGSFGPMCTLSASLSAMDAIKLLSKIIPPSNINRRGEFNIYNMDFQYTYFKRIDKCEWCGEKGIFNKDNINDRI